MIGQPRTARAADARDLLAAGTSLAVASAVAQLLSDQVALAHAAPELLSVEDASAEQLARLRDASNGLTQSVAAFREAVRPELLAGSRDRMALAVAEAEHIQARAREAAHDGPAHVAASVSPS